MNKELEKLCLLIASGLAGHKDEPVNIGTIETELKDKSDRERLPEKPISVADVLRVTIPRR